MTLKRQNLEFGSFDVGGALTAHRFVKIGDTEGDQVVLCGAGEGAVGIIEDAFPADYAGPVRVTVHGTEWIEAGEALAVDVPVTSDSTGRAVEAAAGEEISGFTASSVAAAGHIVSVRLQRQAAPLV